MARNIEIKARIADLGPIRQRAATLTSEPTEVFEQTDTFFVVPRGRLKVRAFADGSGELISYERADQHGPRQSVYSRVPSQDAAALCDALSRVLSIRGRVEKHREVIMVGRARIHLDRVARLGSFLEIEVVMADGEPDEAGRREAEELLRALEIPSATLLAHAYIDLIEGVNSRPE
jgi:predicted adenylyl cyclase CyaB